MPSGVPTSPKNNHNNMSSLIQNLIPKKNHRKIPKLASVGLLLIIKLWIED